MLFFAKNNKLPDNTPPSEVKAPAPPRRARTARQRETASGNLGALFDATTAPQRAADRVRELSAGIPAPAAGLGPLGNGGASFPHSAQAASAAEEIAPENKKDRSTIPARWDLLDRVKKLCRPADPLERGPSVCGCGTPADYPGAPGQVNIHLRPAPGGTTRAGVSGVYRCGSPWLCPVCAPKKAVERKERVARVVEVAQDKGMLVVAVALTAHHTAQQAFAEVKGLIEGASRTARAGRKWKEIQLDHGIIGVVAGKETTISRKNGWHYHQHLLLIIDPTSEVVDAAIAAEDENAALRAAAEAAGRAVADRYAAEIRKAGGWLSKEHGTKIRVCDNPEQAGDYAAKGSAAWEAAGGPTKAETRNAEGMSLTPWDLAELAYAGNPWAKRMWAEYVEVMPGTQSCRVSWQLAEKLGIEAADDAEGGEQVVEERDHIVGHVEAPVWSRWLRHGLVSTFLQRVEFHGEVGFEQAVSDTEADSSRIDAWYARRAVETRLAQDDADAALMAEARILWAYRIARELAESGSGGRHQIAEAIKRLPDHAVAPSPEDVVAALAKIGRAFSPANDDPPRLPDRNERAA